MLTREVIGASLVLGSMFGMACQGGAPAAPAASPQAVPAAAPVFVLPEGSYTLVIDIDKSCAVPSQYKRMTYDVEATIGSRSWSSLTTMQRRPVSVLGEMLPWAFFKWNAYDLEGCNVADGISDPPLYVCGMGTLGATATGYEGDIIGGAGIGDASSCGWNARHHVTLTRRP